MSPDTGENLYKFFLRWRRKHLTASMFGEFASGFQSMFSGTPGKNKFFRNRNGIDSKACFSGTLGRIVEGNVACVVSKIAKNQDQHAPLEARGPIHFDGANGVV